MRGGRARLLARGAIGALVSVVTALLALPVAAAAPQVVTVVGGRAAGSGGVGRLAEAARLDQPSGIALDGAGDLFIADTGNCAVDEVPAHPGIHYGVAMKASHFYVVAGTGCGGHGGVGFPSGVAVDPYGDLYIADATGDRVLELPVGGGRVLSASARAARLRTVAGTGSPGSEGEGGPAASAQLDQPTGVAVDSSGDLFIADTEGCRVDEVPAVTGLNYGIAMQAGGLYTVAGTGTCGTAGLGGPATEAELWNPTAVALDQAGDVLVADRGNGAVVELAVASGTYYGTPIGAGDLAPVAGAGVSASYLADGFTPTGPVGEVNDPEGLVVAPDGDLYIADSTEQVIRVVPAVGGTLFGRSMDAAKLYTVVGALPTGTGHDDTHWVTARVTTPYGLALDAAGGLYFSDRGANKVLRLGP